MTPDTYTALLKDLQKLEKKIAAENIDACRKEGALRERIKNLHREAEVGGSLDDFCQMTARRSAVRLLLRTVYVRVLEDQGLLDPPRLRGQWGFSAFREVAPALQYRAYLFWTFRDLAHDFPELFTPTEEELDLPSEEICSEIWELWHRQDGAGSLVYQWNGEGFDSRFLGDLYQDLDAEVRKRYALLQTPRFVEQYILQKTLSPALKELDPEQLEKKGQTFRLIDPTCGSGHFLVGAFHRLADYWEARGKDKASAAQKALESVHGCDLNPHAVDIARFRLLLEVMTRTGQKTLDDLAKVKANLRALDSLIPWEGRRGQMELVGTKDPAMDRLARYASAEEREENRRFLGKSFHVVVGNPPYVTPKDVQKREDYRIFWPDSCHRSYALAAPFAERFFSLGVKGAYVGQITANSFMKREFGKKLVEKVLPTWDLTGVIDTSGAYIPGHGTPTTILIGRAQPPVATTVWAILGKRGEPRRPEEPKKGLVWSAITAAGDEPNDESPFVTVAHVERSTFAKHPWSLGGGAAPEIQKHIESQSWERLAARIATQIGFQCITGEDSTYSDSLDAWRRDGAFPKYLHEFVEGEQIRDFHISPGLLAFVPMGSFTGAVLDEDKLGLVQRRLWRVKQVLRTRIVSGSTSMEKAGRKWYDLRRLSREKSATPASITFAFVSTHNHFVLDRGGKVFNRSAPVIKLPATATLDDHLDLLGLLNSSTLAFWMKQVCHNKGNSTDSAGARTTGEYCFDSFEYDSTKLQKTPIVTRDREARIALTKALDALAAERAKTLPSAILASSFAPADLPQTLSEGRARYTALTRKMVALQEELDWLTYGSYGLLDALSPAAAQPPLPREAGEGSEKTALSPAPLPHSVGEGSREARGRGPAPLTDPDAIEPLSPGHRPFEILLARRDEEADEEEKTAWFTRHGHERVTDIPTHYTEETRARMEARLRRIEESPFLQLLERPAHKRRWQLADLDKETQNAAEAWLLDRLEDLFSPTLSPAAAQPPLPREAGEGSEKGAPSSAPLPHSVGEGSAKRSEAGGEGLLSEPRPYRLEEIVSAWRKDPRAGAVATVLAGTANVDLDALCERLLRENALPDNPQNVYTDEGIRKLRLWQKTWHLQDLEDQQKPLLDPETNEVLQKIPLPPPYAKTDFQRAEFFKLRGKLNVPRERFLLFSELSPPRYGWNGWRDLSRALCQTEAYTLAESDPQNPLPMPTADDPRRCGVTLGLWESLPDVSRWSDADHHEELSSLAKEVCGQSRCPCAVLESWKLHRAGKLPTKGEKREEKKAEVTLEERARVADMLVLFGESGATLMELGKQWPGRNERLADILDDLTASADVKTKGRGKKKKFILHQKKVTGG